ncbi:peroxidasin homolog, partial [Patella vulgata]|uniref:peroxidasin homolog n=1 Tax=Patella vulgata TaxID=6465 RepID=UPI00217F70FB
TWSKDNLPLPNNGRYQIENRGQILKIFRTQTEDQGIYTCKTENAAGEVIASARLVIQSSVAPSFNERLRTVETNTGIDLTLQCEAEGDPQPSYKWNREGLHLTTDAKFIVQGGRLIIRNIILGDTGRYDCIAENVAGRSTMSINLLVHADERETIQRDRIRNRPLNPGSIQPTNIRPLFPAGRDLQDARLTRLYQRQRLNQFPRYTPIRSGHHDNRLTPREIERAISQATNRVNTGINDTIMDLFSNNRNHSVHDLLSIFRYPAPEALELARAEEIFEQTLEILHTHINQGHMYNLTQHDETYRELVSPAHLTLIANMSGCARRPMDIDCSNICFHRKYRTLNGICNNFKNPTWGTSNQAFLRLLPPIYENGFNTPVGWNRGKMYNNIHLPSPRLISSFMMSTDHVTMDEVYSHMLMQWGQFLDHDLTLSPQSISFARFSDGQRCNETCENVSPCFPISVPNSDQRIRSTCLGFTRSSATCNTGTTSLFFNTVAPRQQINALTSFIDASNVYGSGPDEANALRDLTNERGLLRVGPSINGNRLLPFDDDTLHRVDCQLDATKRHVPCFKGGDHRVNEQIALTAMHTLMMREHNRIATILEELNPHWDGNKLYHETRKIIGAVMQHITYNGWLPKVIGSKGMAMMGEYNGYNPNVDPTIVNEFATAAFRFGHSLVQPVIFRLNESYQPIPEGNLPLHKAFFSPYRILEEGGIDPLLRGLYGVAAKKRMPGELLNTELTEKLFSLANSVGQDLASLNIQRGRDHGLPFYTSYRKYCNLSAVNSFEDLIHEVQHADTLEKLRAVYTHVDNIDLFVGGMSETPAPGAKIGPTFLCIISNQFMRLRDGDRFWYENPGVFTPEQLDQIKQSSLARIICDNSDGIRTLQHDAFLFKTQEEMISCEDIPKLDLRMWTDCCEECRRNNFESFTRHFRSRNQFSFPDNRPFNQFGGRSFQQTPVNTRINSFQQDQPIYDDHSEEEIKEDMTALNSRLEGVESVMEEMSKTIKHLKKKVRFLQKQMKGGKKQHTCMDFDKQIRNNNEKWNMNECKICICKRGKIECMSETCPQVSCQSPIKMEGKCCPVCS